MKAKLVFLGASKNVTGSKYLLEVNGSRVLIDCGLYQERGLKDRNWKRLSVAPESIDAVLLTHAHLDHCGLLPKLVKDGFCGKIHCTAATAEIAQIILLDSAHLQEEDAEFKRRRHEREGRSSQFTPEPLYNTEDAEATLPLFAPIDYETTVKIGEGIEASFHDAGHVLGASMIQVKVKTGSEIRTLLFSGDIGRADKPILRDPTQFAQADYVLIESTYGDRVHRDAADIPTMLEEIINSTAKAGGNIIIPSFALERSQEVLYHLNELFRADRIPHLTVFLDSPMAIRITEVFKHHAELYDSEMQELYRNGESPFAFSGLKMTSSTKESKGINHIKGTVVIIAGSGMCSGGRVKHHLANNIERQESTILFVGYQAAGTLGRQILDGAPEVRILGQMRPVEARIARIQGFSAHADRDELLGWLMGLKSPPRRVFVVHGEAGAETKFGKFLAEKTGWDIVVPDYLDEIELD